MAASELRRPDAQLFSDAKACDTYLGFERKPDLDADGYLLQERSITTYLIAQDLLIERYVERHGFVADTDAARELFESIGYAGHNATAVHEASSALAKEVWRRGLLEGKGTEAALFAGGPGSGKSSAIKGLYSKRLEKAAVVLDGTLGSQRSARARIKEAIAAGKVPVVYYVYRDPADAWVGGVIKRAVADREAGGRVVPISQFLKTHAGALKTVQSLLDDSNITVLAIDNSRTAGEQRPLGLDELRDLSVNIDHAELVKSVDLAFREGRPYGYISSEQRQELLK